MLSWRTAWLTLALVPALPPPSAMAIELSLPVACEIGKACFVQNYVDLDPGPGARDYACRAATYDGHKGTDFRVRSAAETVSSVPVLAAAPGKVKGVRDGVIDIFASDGGRDRVQGRECGNGLVIDHGGGWETQYCHLRRGSLLVKSGDTVDRGQPLGAIGYSGLADFAHVHLSVRLDGKVVDPFLHPAPVGESCASDPGRAVGIWAPDTRARLSYRDGEIIAAGFSEEVPQTRELERDGEPRAPTSRSSKLLFYLRVINLRAGDRLRLVLKGPGGLEVNSTTEPVDRSKAVYHAFVGKPLKAAQWPEGTYVGQGEVLREGSVHSTTTTELALRP